MHMTFTKLSIKHSKAYQAIDEATSKTETDIWVIFRALRDSHSQFGLRPNHMHTLQAMLSFLKPGQGETVFASNFQICRRVGGIDERTLRRHIDRFVELGFMTRRDSPNRKRYRVRSSGGQSISYGLSLSPLIGRANELMEMAQEVENRRRDCIFVRKQILTRLAQIEEFWPESTFPSEVRKTLRRKLSLAEYHALHAKAQAECDLMSTAVDVPETTHLSANDGQIARHHSKSIKEDIDLERSQKPEVRTLTSICDQATALAPKTLRTWEDVEHHAKTLAPMMGIHASTFEKAKKAIGNREASSAVFLMLKFGNRIRNFGAYFHSITLGRRVHQFDPSRLLERLANSEGVPT
ncbi:plasmid replication protein RepC [Oceaniglobus ichthyenteri]|uniref:plasmid replication protein RepC n=1 Tax=Oceaniglobus ichthyenteri TaxID=2136177 RepID=UPI001F0B7EDD|nr:plasmid replication protein RepC [Oceaniglobus ichthyenteri]